jgi:hypothetical protein
MNRKTLMRSGIAFAARLTSAADLRARAWLLPATISSESLL